MTAYPGRVPQQAYAWARSHEMVADGLLGLVLLACSARQLRLSPASTAFTVAAASGWRWRTTVPAAPASQTAEG
jgi:hypothetical protein